jgi:hypothetical protein
MNAASLSLYVNTGKGLSRVFTTSTPMLMRVLRWLPTSCVSDTKTLHGSSTSRRYWGLSVNVEYHACPPHVLPVHWPHTLYLCHSPPSPTVLKRRQMYTELKCCTKSSKHIQNVPASASASEVPRSCRRSAGVHLHRPIDRRITVTVRLGSCEMKRTRTT